MLAAGAPAAEVMTEYVRACRRLGHSVPEPAHLHAAYTAEEGLDLQALDDDRRTLSEALAAAEAALVLQEQARRALAAVWRGAGAVAAVDHLVRHTETAATVVDGLRASVAALGELRNHLWQLIDAKVDSTQGIEARGTRAEWLSAARTVTTGAGDRAAASEMVDMHVAPFVANDIALDWASTMRDTETAIRQAYRDAAAAIASQATVVFDRPGLSGTIPVAAEPDSAPAARASVAPAGFVAGPAPADAAPAQIPVGPTVAPAALPVAATATPPPPPPPPVADPMAAAPMASGASPLGSGMSGLSGLGQSFADMLGGLLGSDGGLGESLGAAGELDSLADDEPEADELDGLTERDPDDEDDEDDEDPEDAEPPAEEGAAEEPVEQAEAEAPAEPVAPVAVPPEPVVPTPVPEPLADPAVAAPAEPVPADTPCEIAADELPQAGP
ncbi:hypothetical protein C6A86_005520 [Mycobacterium sp. ITM-2016-00316]|uniref:hypothetical protein n=1 Tax=Mycobacterium sp. ITM-2016-00316 TaxID=2099695 RepID=UPI00287F8723|nr:hypothetical protein [Mycobacterium sp. ITM-2016-00316]WNG83135.1 hypothetical protein C6A86_005520 [Mycobacterium sp. ITM-2016-00316]